jgi:hypothetical protein
MPNLQYGKAAREVPPIQSNPTVEFLAELERRSRQYRVNRSTPTKAVVDLCLSIALFGLSGKSIAETELEAAKAPGPPRSRPYPRAGTSDSPLSATAQPQADHAGRGTGSRPHRPSPAARRRRWHERHDATAALGRAGYTSASVRSGCRCQWQHRPGLPHWAAASLRQ